MIVEYKKYENLSVDEIKKILREEGFKNIYVWIDSEGTKYPDHTHDYYSAHIVLEGEIKIISQGKKYTFRKGDRFDVFKDEIHAAEVGKGGCKYIIGEK